MSEIYPPYSGEDATCPKCRGNINTDYHPAGTRYVGPGTARLAKGADEWLCRTCINCGYTWPEQCADSHVDTMFGDTP